MCLSDLLNLKALSLAKCFSIFCAYYICSFKETRNLLRRPIWDMYLHFRISSVLFFEGGNASRATIFLNLGSADP